MTEGLNEQREREDQQEGEDQQDGEAIQNRKHQLWSFSKVLLLTTDNNVSATFDRRKEETINQRFLDRRLPIQYKHPYITDLGGKNPFHISTRSQMPVIISMSHSRNLSWQQSINIRRSGYNCSLWQMHTVEIFKPHMIFTIYSLSIVVQS